MKLLLIQSNLFIALLSITLSYAQDLRTDSSFFYEKSQEYKEWLKYSGYTQVIKFDSLNVQSDKLSLFLGSNIGNMDSLAASWCQLQKEYDSKIDYSIYKELFNRFVFDMEIDKDSAVINIIGKTDYLFNVKILFNEDYIVTENFAPCYTMGQSKIKFKLEDINCVGNDSTINTSETLKTIRSKISNYLQDYYKNYGAFSHDADIDIIADNRNELTFEISDINNLILGGVRNFFEYHLIIVEVQKEDDDIIIGINLLAKYGSGILRVPRKNDYKNMDPEYATYVEIFEKRLKNNIIKLLTE